MRKFTAFTWALLFMLASSLYPQASPSFRTDAAILAIPGIGGSAAVSLAWRFDTSIIEADPGNGLFRFNNAAIGSTTNIFFDDNADSGFDVGTIFAQLVVGNQIYIQQDDTAANAVLFTLTDTAQDNTGWWDIPVAVDAAGSNIGNNKRSTTLFVGVGGSGSGDLRSDGSVSMAGTFDFDSNAIINITGITSEEDTGIAISALDADASGVADQIDFRTDNNVTQWRLTSTELRPATDLTEDIGLANTAVNRVFTQSIEGATAASSLTLRSAEDDGVVISALDADASGVADSIEFQTDNNVRRWRILANGNLIAEPGEILFVDQINDQVSTGPVFMGRGIKVPTSTIDAATIVTDTDGRQIVVCTHVAGGGYTVTLPTLSANIGRFLWFKRDDPTDTITIDGEGAEVIDGAATFALSADQDFIGIIGEATEWRIIAQSGGGAAGPDHSAMPNDVIPSVDATFDLGSATFSWLEGHIDTLFADAVQATNFTNKAGTGAARFDEGLIVDGGNTITLEEAANIQDLSNSAHIRYHVGAANTGGLGYSGNPVMFRNSLIRQTWGNTSTTLGTDYLPTVDATFDLGSALFEWAEAHVTDLFVYDDLTLFSDGARITFSDGEFMSYDATTDELRFNSGSSTEYLDLGNGSARFNNVLMNSFIAPTIGGNTDLGLATSNFRNGYINSLFLDDHIQAGSPHTITDFDGHMFIDMTGAGANTVNLPTRSTNEGRLLLIRQSGVADSVTIDGEGAETIEGSLTFVLTVDDTWVWLMATQLEWKIIGSSGFGNGDFFASGATAMTGDLNLNSNDLINTGNVAPVSDNTGFLGTPLVRFASIAAKQVFHGQDTFDGNVTLADTDGVFFLRSEDTAGGGKTVTLPTLADNLGRLLIIKRDDPADTITVDGEGAETIDGATTFALDNDDDYVFLIAQAAEWKIISQTAAAVDLSAIAENVLPATDLTWDLGGPSFAWAELYTQVIHGGANSSVLQMVSAEDTPVVLSALDTNSDSALDEIRFNVNNGDAQWFISDTELRPAGDGTENIGTAAARVNQLFPVQVIYLDDETDDVASPVALTAASNKYQYADTAAGDVEYDLPTCGTGTNDGLEFFFQKLGFTGGNMIIDPNASELLNQSSSSKTITRRVNGLQIRCKATGADQGWFTIDENYDFLQTNLTPAANTFDLGTSATHWGEGHIDDAFVYDDLEFESDFSRTTQFDGNFVDYESTANQLRVNGSATRFYDFDDGPTDDTYVANTSMNPDADNGADLGTTSLSWRQGWINSLFVQEITQDGALTITDTDGNLYITAQDTAGGGKTVTLPTLADNQGRIIVVKRDDAADTITVDAEGAETIDGQPTVLLIADNDYVMMVADTAEWKIISKSGALANWSDGTGDFLPNVNGTRDVGGASNTVVRVYANQFGTGSISTVMNDLRGDTAFRDLGITSNEWWHLYVNSVRFDDLESTSTPQAVNIISSNKYHYADTTSNSIEYDLPTCDSQADRHEYVFTKLIAANNMTIDPFSSETIDGSSTTVSISAQYESLKIRCKNTGATTGWFRIP